MGDGTCRINGVKLKSVDTGEALDPKYFEANGEDKFKDFLQKTYRRNRLFIDKIMKPASRSVKVSWLGREFRTVDFFGISEDGYLLLVEVKVETPKSKKQKRGKSLATQIKEDMAKFINDAGELESDFKEKCVDYAFGGRKQIYKMEFGESIQKRRVKEVSAFDLAYKKIFGKGKKFQFNGIKVFIIAPTFSQKISRDLSRLSEKLSPANVKFKYILFDKKFESSPKLYYCRINLS